MPKLPKPRKGQPLRVRTRLLRFSYWPMRKGRRRFELQSMIFATNPWSFLKNIITKKSKAKSRAEALAYIDQAEDFYESTKTAKVYAAKPLLTYYCFMNLVKAFILTKSNIGSFKKAKHGIQAIPNEKEIDILQNQFFVNFKYKTGQVNLFDLFGKTLAGNSYNYIRKFTVKRALSQIVAGHRIFVQAKGIRERFISIKSFEFFQDADKKNTWITFTVYADDLERIDVRQKNLLKYSRLDKTFRQIMHTHDANRKLLRFELMLPLKYSQRAADKSQEIADSFRHYLWTMITTMPPFRKYYLYLIDKPEHKYLLPQLMSIYAVMYYLGSVTRYQPHLFNKILKGKYGAQILDIINSQPNQFVYHMASEFAEQEVTLPAIV